MGANPEIELSELLEEVRRIEVMSHRLVTDLMAGGYSSVFRGSGVEFDEVREYVDGDDPRSVDWNVTARLGRPYIKKFVDERELTALFLFDLSASMTGGFSHWSARQMAARVCACLGFAAVKNQDNLGLIAFDDEVRMFLSPDKGLGHVLRLIRECLALPSSERPGSFETALEYLRRVMRRRIVVFIVSDFLDLEPSDALTRCALKHDVVAIRLLPRELDPPSAGLVRHEDPESGDTVVVDWSDSEFRQHYLDRVADWRQRCDEIFRRAAIDVMDVPVPKTREPEAIARPIYEFFRRREARGAKR